MEENPFAAHRARTRQRVLLWVTMALVIGIPALIWRWLVGRETARRHEFHERIVHVKDEKERPRVEALRKALLGELVPRPDLGASGIPIDQLPTTEIDVDYHLEHSAMALKSGWPNEENFEAWKKGLDDWDKEVDFVSDTVRHQIWRSANREDDDSHWVTHIYLYDFKTNRILCALDVTFPDRDAGAKTSLTTDAGLEISYTKTTMQLWKVGPPLDAGAP